MRGKIILVLTVVMILVTASVVFAQDKPLTGKTLKMIMIADPFVGAFEKINAKFEEITGAKVVMDSYPYDATHEKELISLAAGTGDYDVIVYDIPWVGEFVEGGFVEDLEPYIAKEDPKVMAMEDYFPVGLEAGKWKGKVYGLPFGLYFVLTHYRKDLFDAAGVTAPKTLQEMKDRAKLFTNNPNFPGVFGISMNFKRGAPVGQGWFEYIWNFGGKYFKGVYPGSTTEDWTPTFDTKEGVDVVKYFKEMLQYAPPGALNYAWDEKAMALQQGKVTMMSEWTVRTPMMWDEKLSKVLGKIDTTVFPAGADGKTAPPVGGWVMGIANSSKSKDVAWEFIKWFCSPEIHKEFCKMGGPASRFSAVNDPELMKAYPWYKTIAETAPLTFVDCRPRIPESFEIIDVVGLKLSEALQDQITPEQAMKDIQGYVTILMQKGGYLK
ncbi:MAG: sugar ABC transporter substrate-binding protein [Candidatus Atribacteria bacterium]|nr:sugar ABC transporter substrate-binding protein [Candidatus Atribacteria bacterium]